ncbi:hypothetical protein BDZ89DRAFT_823562 [Hymenopellis radicata]|nr:hypothetical protein BDZ89DRAFT_823562 [Hymenopellis radicata]
MIHHTSIIEYGICIHRRMASWLVQPEESHCSERGRMGHLRPRRSPQSRCSMDGDVFNKRPTLSIATRPNGTDQNETESRRRKDQVTAQIWSSKMCKLGCLWVAHNRTVPAHWNGASEQKCLGWSILLAVSRVYVYHSTMPLRTQYRCFRSSHDGRQQR